MYDFLTNEVPGATERDAGYWRDVGTLDSYFDAHMDLCAVHPVFNLYNDRWPILTDVPSQPPAKFVHDSGDRVGRAIDSLVSNGVIVSGGLVRESVLSPGVRVNSWARVERSVVLDNTDHRPARGDRERDHRQERRPCPRASSSAWTRSTTGSAASSVSDGRRSPWWARARR